ncbi:MAG: protein kinase, partial [Phycisphaerae bacterium]|nr:protein kinase [Phycisphaerae bacterium]
MADKEHNEQQHQKDPEKLLTVSSDGVEGNGGLSGGAEPAIPDQIDDFKILEKIGEGGMGKVYRAYEKRLERVVALKILRPEIANNPSVAKRFRREAILAANLSHPNIVPVYHVDNRDKPRYFTMEFVQGRSLKAKVEEEGFLSPAEA